MDVEKELERTFLLTFKCITGFSFRFTMCQPWICANAAARLCLQYVHHFELRH